MGVAVPLAVGVGVSVVSVVGLAVGEAVMIGVWVGVPLGVADGVAVGVRGGVSGKSDSTHWGSKPFPGTPTPPLMSTPCQSFRLSSDNMVLPGPSDIW